MKRYTIKGTNREVGAIGIMVPFETTVEAASVEEAKDKARTQRYDANHEHVLIMTVTEAAD